MKPTKKQTESQIVLEEKFRDTHRYIDNYERLMDEIVGESTAWYSIREKSTAHNFLHRFKNLLANVTKCRFVPSLIAGDLEKAKHSSDKQFSKHRKTHGKNF